MCVCACVRVRVYARVPMCPPRGSESKLKKTLLSDHYGGKNDRKSLTPTVFQALMVPGTQIETQDLSEECALRVIPAQQTSFDART